MALLGKLLKGKTTRAIPEGQRRNVKVRQQNKTQEELDQEKKLIKMKRDFLRNALAGEEKIINYNRRKLLTNWRNTMRIAKTEQLRNEIEIYSQNNQRELDSKEAMLQMLDKNLDEADEQYQMALKNHLIHIDEFIALQDSRLASMESEFSRDVRILEDEYSTEREEIVNIQKRQIQELDELIETIDEDAKAKALAAKQDFENFREDIKNRNMEEQDNIRLQLEGKQKKLNTNLETLHQRYISETQSKNDDHFSLFTNNKNKTKDIDKHVKDIDRLKAKIEHMKLKIHQHTKESKKKNDALRTEKENISKNYQELKSKMMKAREDKTRRLTELVTNSRQSVLTLKDSLTLGERTLKLAELCRKLETEREKVLPFYDSTVEDATVPEELRGEFEEITPEQYAEYTYLNNFYKRFNKVLLDKLAIDKQKTQLEKENQILKTMLKQYLDGISVNDEVIRNPNPLLVVNNKINIERLPIEKTEAPNTIVEGARVYQQYRLQNS